MRTQLLSIIVATAAMLAPASAGASPRDSADPPHLTSSEVQARHDSLRVRYHGVLMTIAARDLATARAQARLTGELRDAAARKHDLHAARDLSIQHAQAVREVREARRRLAAQSRALDIARADFRRDAEQISRLDAQNRKRG